MVVVWPVEPMIARPAETIPAGDRWWYQPKLDGFRCLALRPEAGRVQLQSRRQRSLAAAFPEIVELAATRLPPGTVVDGELVALVEGRADFEALQRRLASRRAGAPVTLVAFDLLAHQGHDLRARPLWARRELLRQVITGDSEGLALMPTTTGLAGAEAWMRQQDRGVEGVVAKRADHAYLPRRRHWTKIRARATCEAVVGGVSGPLARPRGLILGRYDEHGRLRVIGRTGPLSREAAAELARRLRPPRQAHPWPEALPGGRFGLAGGEMVEYTQVAPELVAEIEADSAYEWGRYRHPSRFVRLRAELHPLDVRADSSDAWPEGHGDL